MSNFRFKKRTPRESRTFDQICDLSHDNVCQGDFWMMLSEADVYLSEQPSGDVQKQAIKIPRKAFNAFVDWYMTGKVPRGDKAAREGK